MWLIVLELTVISFGWSFAFPYLPFMQVIWAIGWSMIALSALIWLPRMAVLAIGLAIVAGHNLLDPIAPGAFGSAGVVWTLLHDGGPIFAGYMYDHTGSYETSFVVLGILAALGSVLFIVAGPPKRARIEVAPVSAYTAPLPSDP